ncbi:uncharacterized protein SRS1_11529 [Sporisorium reilianum f. sp. reilianum]|uniref:Zn(2)-C6 fungal-type domain-containing protein n=1 Tax=Sporisorium reilianum f. sp. reilianum TaxID=72559 RepID=A0A2N8U5B2_9BASI|nr:uncharacterized protein SRS1_11529 [Sporisorium reilianum f. sp. reilianum]
MSDPAKPNVNTRMPKGAKRPKTSRACLACRKLKARCEPPGGAKASSFTDDPQSSNPVFPICHRCKTLCIDCLYENSAGQVVQGQDWQPTTSTPSPTTEPKRSSRTNKRSRADDLKAATPDPFTNDRAVFLSPAISPCPLTRSIYRDVDICSLNTPSAAHLERPVLAANALSRLIGAAPTLKPQAQEYILGLSGAFRPDARPSLDCKQAPPALCAAKAAARLMSGQTTAAPYPADELDFLILTLQPYEPSLRITFHGLYGAFTPFLSTPFEDSLILSTCQSEAQCFLLLTIYLVALPHLESTLPIGTTKRTLRKAVDVLLRRTIHCPQNDHLNIFALHNCASFLLLPVDGFADDSRPLSTPEQENDGLLEFAADLNPRAVIITALLVAQRLGYASFADKLPSIRQASEADSPANGATGDTARDEFAHAVLCTFTWLTLLQFRASIDFAEDRVEWDSLSQFEQAIPAMSISAMTAALLPPPPFLSPREQSRCCWMAQRAELYTIARDHRHTKRSAASLSKKEAEHQAFAYKKALDEWRYKFNEQMRSMSTGFRKDPRGLGLHRYYSIFSNAEAQSLQVSIGSVYHHEFVADMRQRLPEPFYTDNLPWKTAATVMLGHESDGLTKAILINFAFTDAMLKAMGFISSLTPVMPQLYDFVSYEQTAASEIPSLCIVAPPVLQAALFAVPLLAAADLRLSVIETWGGSASYFNHHLLPLLTNCVKSLRACHVHVDPPGVLKMPFTTANPIANYLQGPFEILMRKIASVEERLQISHVESILSNAFLLSSKKKEIEKIAEELAPETPEMVQAIADSQKIEDEISASMTGSLQVQSVEEINDTEYAVRVFGSDMREGDVRPIRKPGHSAGSSATTPEAEAHGRAGGSTEKEPIRSVPTMTTTSSAPEASSAAVVLPSAQPASTLQTEASFVPTGDANRPQSSAADGQQVQHPFGNFADYAASSIMDPLQPPPTATLSDSQSAAQQGRQPDFVYPTFYPDQGPPGTASSQAYPQVEALEGAPAVAEYIAHAKGAAYGSFPAGHEAYLTERVFAHEPGSDPRVPPSAHAFAYLLGSDVPPLQARPSQEGLPGANAAVSGYEAHNPQPPRPSAGAASVLDSRPWSQPPPSVVEQPQGGYTHVNGSRGPARSGAYAAAGQLSIAAPQGEHYYIDQQQAPTAQYRFVDSGINGQIPAAQQQMRPNHHAASALPTDHQHPGDTQASAAWDVWDWTPAQQQQQQQQYSQHQG